MTIAYNGTKLIVEPLPLSEGGSIDDNNGVLDESLSSHQLIVSGVVDNVDDPGLSGDGLAWPGEVALVQPESPVLLVALN